MAITFDAVDDKVTATALSTLAPYNAAWTFSCWLYPTIDTVGGGDPRIFQKGSVNVALEATRRWYIQIDGSTALDIHAAVGSEFTFNTWQHFVVTSDGSTTATNYHLFRNGVEPSYSGATNGVTLTNNLSATLTIGNSGDGTRPLGGRMTEVAFWNKVLSAGEIASLYGSGTPAKGTPRNVAVGNLMAYWPFDDGTVGTSADGDTIYDKSISGANATGDDGADNLGLSWSSDPWTVPSTTGEVLPASATGSAIGAWIDDVWAATAAVLTQGAGSADAANVTAATFDDGDQCQVLKVTNFNFAAIVAGSIIHGVIARFEGWAVTSGATAVSAGLDYCRLLDTSRAEAGENIVSTGAGFGATVWLSATTQIVCVGNSANLWSCALTANWVNNANFGVALGFRAGGNNLDLFIDYVTLEVIYTPPAGATPLSLQYHFMEC